MKQASKGHSLEVILTHIPVKRIPLHTLETPLCKVMAGIKVLAGILTVFDYLVIWRTIDNASYIAGSRGREVIG